MKNRIALLGIIVEDLDQSAQINDLLHEYGHHIMGRLGVPYRERGLSIISIIMDAPIDVANALTGKLGRIPHVQVKIQFTKE